MLTNKTFEIVLISILFLRLNNFSDIFKEGFIRSCVSKLREIQFPITPIRKVFQVFKNVRGKKLAILENILHCALLDYTSRGKNHTTNMN